MKFATKPQLAQQMLQSAWDAGRSRWFVAVGLRLAAGVEVYGHDGSFWWWLEKTGKQPYVLTVNKKQSFVIGWQNYRAEDLLESIATEQWQRLSYGNGSKGEREYEWARIEVTCDRSEGFQRWLVFRRSLEHPNEPRCISYYQVFAPAETSLETIVTV